MSSCLPPTSLVTCGPLYFLICAEWQLEWTATSSQALFTFFSQSVTLLNSVQHPPAFCHALFSLLVPLTPVHPLLTHCSSAFSPSYPLSCKLSSFPSASLNISLSNLFSPPKSVSPTPAAFRSPAITATTASNHSVISMQEGRMVQW